MKPLTTEEIAEWRERLKHDLQFDGSPEELEVARRLLDDVERSRMLLGRIEWVARCCPACGGDRPYTLGEGSRFGGHLTGCELAALIGAPVRPAPRVATLEPQSDRDTGFSVPVDEE